MAAASQTSEFEAAIEAELQGMFRSRDLALVRHDDLSHGLGIG